jgi:hypothetical protein
MNERMSVTVTILLGVAAVAAVLWVIGWRNRTLPGKQGIKGTGLESSVALYRLQMASLAILLLACLFAAVWLLWR